MNNTLHFDRNDIPSTLLRAVDGYSGRKFRVTARESVTLTDMQWSGGTRSTYTVVNLATGETKPITDPRPFPQNQYTPEPIKTVNDWCVVEHSMFCGKDMGITFHVHPDNIDRSKGEMLLLPNVRLPTFIHTRSAN